MRRTAPVALAVLFLHLTSSPSLALRARELHELGGSTGWLYEPFRMSLVELGNGGYVAAWEMVQDDSLLGTGARIFDETGTTTGPDVFCTGSEPEDRTYRAALASVGAGFVLGCEDAHPTSVPWFTTHVHRFDADGASIGDPVALDSALASQLSSIVGRDEASYVVSYERCTENSPCADTKQIRRADGNSPGEFVVPRMYSSDLVPITGGRYLAVGTTRSSPSGRYGLFSRTLTRDGNVLDSVTKLARTRREAYLRVVQGAGDRTAVSWTVTKRSGRTAFVRLFDRDGVAQPDNVEIAWSPDTGVPPYDIPTALPLEQGFLLLWTENASRTHVRAYDEDGRPHGDRLTLQPVLRAIAAITYRKLDRSYLIGGFYEDTSTFAPTVGLWRLGFEPRCGDIDGDERVDGVDVQRVLRAAADIEPCDLCRCDVDASGTIDEADAEATLGFALGKAGPECPVCTDE